MPNSARDISFEVNGGNDLKRIAKELRHVSNGREIRKRLTREIRREAKPIVPRVRSAILSIPSKGEGSTGLRSRLAKATKLQVRTTGRDAGVVIRVDGRKMPAGEGRLPAYMEGTKKPWRHPVYGNRNAWVQQQDSHPYFYRIVIPFGLQAKRAVLRAVEKIGRDIT
jgi:hypothetical protein